MIPEILAAVELLTHWARIPSDSVRHSFQSTLTNLLIDKFQGHWDPLRPSQGNGYRAITAHHGTYDTILVQAARMAGISNVQALAFPPDFALWVDPGEVMVVVRSKDMRQPNLMEKILYRTPVVPPSSNSRSPGQEPDGAQWLQQREGAPVPPKLLGTRRPITIRAPPGITMDNHKQSASSGRHV